jgi:hypothetical protein
MQHCKRKIPYLVIAFKQERPRVLGIPLRCIILIETNFWNMSKSVFVYGGLYRKEPPDNGRYSDRSKTE